MFYAITINDAGMITGRHESMEPITPKIFKGHAVFGGDRVLDVDAGSAYKEGVNIACYDEEGRMRPAAWCIQQGYMEMPEGYELIDGELIKADLPVEELPESIGSRLARMGAEAEAEMRATRVMFRALAQADLIGGTEAAENAGMFPEWGDCIGQRAEAGSYWRHEGRLWRVNAGQGHVIRAGWAPGEAAALFSQAADPGEDWPEWIEPTGAHNAYSKGARVRHGGKRWLSALENNTWEPGVYGWEVTDG